MKSKTKKTQRLSQDEQYRTRITDAQQEQIEEFVECEIEDSDMASSCNIGDVVDTLENIIEGAQSLLSSLTRRSTK